jgi:replication factor A1
MLKHIWRGRGRRPSEAHSYKDSRILTYLARIAVKNKVDSYELSNAILEAWHYEESHCNQLTIWCRKKTQESASFLFTNGQKVVAQFPISITLLNAENRLGEYIQEISARISAKEREVVNPKIEDLKFGMKRINLTAEVIEVPKPTTVYTRWGTMASVSNALIGDETGSIKISLWNEQIYTISQGDKIQIVKGKVMSFQGEPQLRLGRQGHVSVIE